MRYSIQEFIIMFLIKVYQVAMSGYVKKKTDSNSLIKTHIFHG